MAIPEELLVQARERMQRSARPLILHDDDCDGVSSFVQCARACPDATGACVKQSPTVGPDFLRKVEEHQPDLIVILDKPDVDPQFFDGTKTPVIWIDHHAPRNELVTRYPNVTYLNPRIWNDLDNRPTSYWVYRIFKRDLWVAMIGCVGDWHVPEFYAEFHERYPDYGPAHPKNVEQLYLDTRLGKLIKAIQFNLKGTITDVKKSIATLAKIDHPDEILEHSTARGRLLWKKYDQLCAAYDRHVAEAKEVAARSGKLLVYAYEDVGHTFTSELSNELLIRYPDKVTLVSRTHDAKRKCSVRSHGIELPTKIERALKGLDGRGGGHTNACGVVVAEKDWVAFCERLGKLIEDDAAPGKN